MKNDGECRIIDVGADMTSMHDAAKKKIPIYEQIFFWNVKNDLKKVKEGIYSTYYCLPSINTPIIWSLLDRSMAP